MKLYTGRFLASYHRRISLRRGCFSTLNAPTELDAQELFQRMNSRPGSLVTDGDAGLDRYNQDWTKHYQGHSSVVVRPQSTEEVASILGYCNERRLGVVPQAGNTGLVGGSVPISSEIVLSVERLNQVEGLDSLSGILKTQAGCILQDMQEYASARDYLVPVDLGAKGTCQIGGNVSTNAGGSYYYRYGSLHANVVGLQVVTPTGDILNLGYDPCHLKDNTGYDLTHLYIGAEGTLGVVTKVALQCPRLFQSKCAAFLACETFEQVLATISLAKAQLSEILAALEFMDAQVLEMVQQQNNKQLGPLPTTTIHPYSLLVETHGSNETHDQEKMQHFVETAMDQGLVVDGMLAQNWSQVDDLWKIRESCNPSVAASGYVYKYDVSLQVTEFPKLIDHVRESLPESAICTNWGHVLDGNLHCNVVVPGQFEKDEDLLELVEDLVLQNVMDRGGSISAEHGLGQYKHKYLPQVKDPATLATMRAVKQLFDPSGIMNPGKYMPIEK